MQSDVTCPVHRTATLIAGKWTVPLIYALGSGTARFVDLQHALPGISPRMLTLRLRRLERAGVVRRGHRRGVPPHVDYRLTPKGLALLPLVEELRRYGEHWLAARRSRGT